MPTGVGLPLGDFGSTTTVSPDGRHVAFVGRRGGTVQLHLRTIQDAETKVLSNTQDATQPFFSPDSRWLAFFAGGKLKKVPTDGGVPVVICDVQGSRGKFWSENGTIVFSPRARGTGIFQVSADGGAAKQITTLDTAAGETGHRLPELLPGGETLLFVAYGATYEDVSIVAQSLKTGERRVLIEGASLPHYASTGHLLYLQPKRPGTIMAVAFDPETLKLAGTPAPVVEGVLTDRGDYAHWSVSRTGMLVYAQGGFKEAENNLVLVDRKGLAAAVGTPPQRPYRFPRLSPDGRRLVVTVAGTQSTLWIYHRVGAAFNRLTFEGNNDWATWTPDGQRVTYASIRAEPWRLFWKPFDGSGKEQMLYATRKSAQQPYSWSSDGKLLVYQDTAPATGQDVWVLPMEGDRQPRPILQTPASELDARLSPDGRWLAYASDESGRYEVYVQPFSGSGGKWQISAEGGREPVWAHNGREVFYRSGEKMMAAAVVTQPTFQTAPPRLLFQGPYEGTNTISPNYDVTADDQRFLMVQQSDQRSRATDFSVVLNWFEELKRRVPLR
jgi:Tol biopolymer transport system component